MSSLNKRLYESLVTVADAVTDGKLSDSSLIKACEIYKWRTSFEEDNKYLLVKSKTFNNFLNGIENNQSLMKALILGQTKIGPNGIVYVVKQIETSGKLDWRIANKQPKKAKVPVDGDLNELFDNEDFPDSISDTDIAQIKPLGGSTGAVLVKDNNNVEYVLKSGASEAHVKEEFLVNSIYKLMGVKVPEMKLYTDISSGNKVSMLSKFITPTVALNTVLDDDFIDTLTDHYVLDCLLANWDIYKNDNVLINTDNDDIIRVDNGGGLRFSAQGRDKGDDFTMDVDEIETMLANNPKLASGVTTKKIEKQIVDIVKNKSKILKLIEDDDLKTIMSSRIISLEMRLVGGMTEEDQYRELTEKELSKAMKICNGNLYATNDNEGWLFLSQIAKMRGFNVKPKVVDKKEFKTLLADKANIMVNRGITHYDNKSAKRLMREFTDSEHCFYGKQAMYGAGIYGAVNKTKINDKDNPNYKIAYGYADNNSDHILDMILPENMNIVDGDDLDKEMMSEFFGPEFQQAKKEYDDQAREINRLKSEKQKIEKGIEDDAKTELGWNEKTYKILRESHPETVYAKTDVHKFEKTLKYFTAVSNSIGATIEKVDDLNYDIRLANGKSFRFNKTSASDPEALKRKAAHLDEYNFQYSLLKNFFINEHFGGIREKVRKRIEFENKFNPKLISIKQEVHDAEIKIQAITDDMNSKKDGVNSGLNNIMAQIAKKPGGEFRGFYAAIKGYDAIIQKKGWGGDTDFCVILNRGKVIVKDFD